MHTLLHVAMFVIAFIVAESCSALIKRAVDRIWPPKRVVARRRKARG